MFTDRVNSLQAEGAYAVLARAQALEAQGRKILHLEIGQPDFPTFPNVSQAGIAAIQTGQTRYNCAPPLPNPFPKSSGWISPRRASWSGRAPSPGCSSPPWPW